MREVTMSDLANRTFLMQLRNAAIAMSNANLNRSWVHAYNDLADAVDRLDAMQARCEVQENESSGLSNDIPGEQNCCIRR